MQKPLPSFSRRRELEERARKMRCAPTWSEAALWRLISARKLGVSFRRQVVVGGRYIADFAASSVRLIVEVDGGYHARRVAADARRDRVLRRDGWRVLRLSEELVTRSPAQAVAAVRAALSE